MLYTAPPCVLNSFKWGEKKTLARFEQISHVIRLNKIQLLNPFPILFVHILQFTDLKAPWKFCFSFSVRVLPYTLLYEILDNIIFRLDRLTFWPFCLKCLTPVQSS